MDVSGLLWMKAFILKDFENTGKSTEVQVSRLSRRKQGFDPPRERQLNQLVKPVIAIKATHVR